jgi:hypothetical protein
MPVIEGKAENPWMFLKMKPALDKRTMQQTKVQMRV